MTDEVSVERLLAPAAAGEGSVSKTTRRALVVAGMHRSGTSAVARVLGLLGATLPVHSGGPADDNETGFWEPLSIVSFDDELLRSAGSSWDDVSPVPDTWFASEFAASQYERAAALVVDEYGPEGMFVMKDPRVCRLIPFWEAALRSSNIEPGFVIPIRNPLEVAASLKRRDGFLTGKSLLLWLGHVLDTERATRGKPRIFLTYQDLLHDWHGETARIGEALGVSWSRTNHEATALIERFLSESHRNHSYADHELAAAENVAAWVKRTYAAVLELCAHGRPAAEDLDALDAVRAEMLDADMSYGPMLASASLELTEQRAAAGRLREELAGLEQELESSRAERAAAATALEEAAAREADLGRSLEAAAANVANLEGRITAEHKRADEGESRIRQMDAALHGVQGEFETEWRRAETLAEELERTRARSSTEQRRVEEIEAKLQAESTRAQEARAEVELLRADLAVRTEAVERYARESNAAAERAASIESQRRRAEEHATAVEAELESERGRAESLATEVEQGRSELQAESARVGEATRELEQTLQEAERLRSELADRGKVVARFVRESREAADQAAEADRRRLEAEESVRRVAADLESERVRVALLSADVARERSKLEDERARVLATTGELEAALAAGERLRGDLAVRGEVVERYERESRWAAEHAVALEERRRQAEEHGHQVEAQLRVVDAERARAVAELESRTFRARLGRLGFRRHGTRRPFSPWLRLRLRYASQMLSWVLHHSPRTSMRWIRTYFALRHSGLFDYRFYVMQYPDVVRARLNPLMHYIEHGAAEGRDPSARFSTRVFIEQHPGLDPRRLNPLIAYRRELRKGGAAQAALPAPVAPEVTPAAIVARKQVANVDVICLPIIDWHYRFQRPQQLCTQFAAGGHRVFYAETKLHDAGREIDVSTLADGVWSLSLPGPPELVIYRDALDDAALGSMVEAFARWRESHGVEHAIVIVDLPFWRSLAFELRRRFGWRVVYDCMDDHAGFLDGAGAPATRARIHDDEERLVVSSDAVLATSRLLHERIADRARRLLLVPNAADFDHFRTQPRPALPAIEALGLLKTPVVGYYGAISAWFDVELVEQAARLRPEWSFVLVGSTFGADVSRLERLPNVMLTDERPYSEIPSFLERFDVACIPFLLNDLTLATNPVKFYEYLSAGKPVVAVDLPELAPYRDHYYSAANGDELVAQVERALAEDSPVRAETRVALARENTWEGRFATIQPVVRSWFGRAAIVVVSYDNPEYLEQCLRSIWKNTSHPDYEVIVVENGTDPAVRAFLDTETEREPRLKVVRPGENAGFARANNLGLQAAGDCEFVVLLNDDTVVTAGWLGRLLSYLDDDSVGLVGPVTNWAGNEARIDVGYDDLVEMHVGSPGTELEFAL